MCPILLFTVVSLCPLCSAYRDVAGPGAGCAACGCCRVGRCAGPRQESMPCSLRFVAPAANHSFPVFPPHCPPSPRLPGGAPLRVMDAADFDWGAARELGRGCKGLAFAVPFNGAEVCVKVSPRGFLCPRWRCEAVCTLFCRVSRSATLIGVFPVVRVRQVAVLGL